MQTERTLVIEIDSGIVQDVYLRGPSGTERAVPFAADVHDYDTDGVDPEYDELCIDARGDEYVRIPLSFAPEGVPDVVVEAQTLRDHVEGLALWAADFSACLGEHSLDDVRRTIEEAHATLSSLAGVLSASLSPHEPDRGGRE